MTYSILKIVIISLLIGLCIFFERLLPFILFSRKDPPKIIKFIEKFIPPLVMAVLVVYCLKDMNFTNGPSGYLPYIAASIFTTVIHIWKGNALFSICGGTILYMILIRIF